LLGRVDEARPLLTGSVADLREIVGDAHQLTAQAAQNLVNFLERENDSAAADPYRGLLDSAQ
jgi:plasmid stabilization system protein ParE